MQNNHKRKLLWLIPLLILVIGGGLFVLLRQQPSQQSTDLQTTANLESANIKVLKSKAARIDELTVDVIYTKQPALKIAANVDINGNLQISGKLKLGGLAPGLLSVNANGEVTSSPAGTSTTTTTTTGGGTAGPRGATGASGAVGATGPAGATGPQGSSGIASCPNGVCLSLQSSTPGVVETGNVNISGSLLAGSFSGNGSAVTNVNAATLQGNSAAFYQNATNINTGILPDAQLSSNIAKLNTNNTFTQANILQGSLTLGISGSANGTIIFRNGTNSNTVTLRSGVTSTSPGYTLILPTALGASGQCVTLADASTGQLGFVTCTGGGGTQTLQDTYNISASPAVIVLADTKDFKISATEQTTDPNILYDLQCVTSCGTNGRFAVQSGGTDVFTISPNGGAVALRNTINSATAFQIKNALGTSALTVDTTNLNVSFGAAVTATSFSGSGANLTNLNGSSISSGIVGDSFLSTNVTKQGNTFNGTSQLVQLTAGGLLPTLNGSNLTNLNADNIGSGTLTVSRGGTGVGSTTAFGLLTGGTTSTGALQNTGAGLAGQILQSSGPSALPSFVTLSGDATIGAGGALTIASSAINSAKIADGAIVNNDINASAGIVDTKLATISTAGKVADTALSSNVALHNTVNLFKGSDVDRFFEVQNAAGITLLDIDTANNQVGIGNIAPATAPTAVLQVKGYDVAAGGGTANTVLRVTGGVGGATNGTGQTGGTGALISLTGGAGGAGQASSTAGNGGNITLQGGAAGAINGGTAGATGNILLQTGAAGGNVGIGDATPLALLTVGNGDLFQINSSGVVTAAAGITSSGSITFSGLGLGVVHSSSGGALTSSGIVNADLTAGSFGNITGVGTLTSGTLGSGFTTVAVGQGGTGATTLTANGILQGNGASAITAIAPAASGTVLLSNGTTASFTTITNLSLTAGSYSNITGVGTLGGLTVSGAVTIQGASALTLGTSGANDGAILFHTAAAGGNTVTLQAPATNPAANIVLKLPANGGSSGQCLQTGGGNTATLSWAACTTGSGTTTLDNAYTNGNTISLTDSRSLTVTAADTAIDPSIVFNLLCTACTTTGQFAVQSNSTNVFRVQGTNVFTSGIASTMLTSPTAAGEGISAVDVLRVTGGNGSDATSATAGTGSNIVMGAGSGGNSNGATGNGGLGGGFTLTAGAGGDKSAGVSSWRAGDGGGFTFTGGLGGNGNTKAGGGGGGFVLQGGTGGPSSGSSGGSGGTIALTGGTGVDGSTAGGAGGTISFTAGGAGNGTTVGGAGGSVTLQATAGGTGSTAGAAGQVRLNPNGTGNVVIGGSAVTTHKLELQGGDINLTTGIFRKGGTAGASTTCTTGQFLDGSVSSGGIITGGTCATASLQKIYDSTADGAPAAITTSAAAKTVQIKAGASSDSASLFQVQGTSSVNVLTVDSETTTDVRKVLVGSATTDTTQILLQPDSFSTHADTATCSTTTNQGGIYYNTSSNAVRACVDGGWEDLASTEGLGLLAYGVVAGSGTNPGDIGSLVSTNVSGPCKVSWASATTVNISACTAYSGGRKIKVAAVTLTMGSATSSIQYYHVCLTGTNDQPVLSSGGNQNANLPTFSATKPILCLATVMQETILGGSGIVRIYDTRTFTTTVKEYTTINAALFPGAVVQNSSTANLVADSTTQSADKLRGVVVATSGSASSTTINGIIAVGGQQFVLAKVATSNVNEFVVNSTFSGRSETQATVPTTGTGAYNILGLAQLTISTACTATTNCQYSQLVDLQIR